MKTYSAKPSDITRKWFILDASEIPLGRLATKAAELLIGKHKPSFTPHIDGGDYVIVINAKNLVVTGNKIQNKMYYRHSQFPGGLHSKTLGVKLETEPTDVITQAIRGMIPANKLRPDRLKRLKVYADAEYKHDPQQPTKISFVKGKK